MSHNCQISVLLEVLDPLTCWWLCWDFSLVYVEVVFCTTQGFCIVGSNKHTDEYTCLIFCGLCWAYVPHLSHFCIVGSFWAMVSSLTQQLNMLMKNLGVLLWIMWRLCPADLSDLCTVASFRHKNWSCWWVCWDHFCCSCWGCVPH